MDDAQKLQFVGLLFDAAGVLVIGVPAVLRRVDEIMQQSMIPFGYGEEQVRLFAKNRVDISSGSVLLLLGFLIQALAVYGPPGSIAWVVLLGTLLPASGIAYYMILRHYWSEKLAGEALRRLRVAYGEDKSD